MDPKLLSTNISVCICTYKRPQMLSNLIHKLQEQNTENLFTFSVTIVDNDPQKSAYPVVIDWQNKSIVPIHYHHEQEPNIAIARNKALRSADGHYVAFIDDDEFPESSWLANHLRTITKHKCAGVLGPVKPHFESKPPAWILKSRICERSSYSSGTILKNQNETRTGNVLLSRELFLYDLKPFNPAFGKTGGEDIDFFSRKMAEGFTFVWCDEAIVFEIVPPERFRKRYYIKRALLRGKVNADRSRILSIGTIKSVVAAVLYTVLLPFLAIAGEHLFMKYLIKDCDHIGKIVSLFGFNIVNKR